MLVFVHSKTKQKIKIMLHEILPNQTVEAAAAQLATVAVGHEVQLTPAPTSELSSTDQKTLLGTFNDMSSLRRNAPPRQPWELAYSADIYVVTHGASVLRSAIAGFDSGKVSPALLLGITGEVLGAQRGGNDQAAHLAAMDKTGLLTSADRSIVEALANGIKHQWQTGGDDQQIMPNVSSLIGGALNRVGADAPSSCALRLTLASMYAGATAGSEFSDGAHNRLASVTAALIVE